MEIYLKQPMKAARYLVKINPRRYFFEREGNVVRLFDKKSRKMTHNRIGTCKLSFGITLYGRPPLFEYLSEVK